MKVKQGSFYNKKVIGIAAIIVVGVLFFYIGKSGQHKTKTTTSQQSQVGIQGEQDANTQQGSTTTTPLSNPTTSSTVTQPTTIASNSINQTPGLPASNNVTTGFNGIPSDPNDGSNGSTNSGYSNSPNNNYSAMGVSQAQSQSDTQAAAAETAPVTFQIANKSTGTVSKTSPNKSGDPNVAFINNTQASSVYLNEQLIKPASPYEVMAGTVIKGSLQTAIDSDIPSKVILARITQNVFDTVNGHYLLIPQGSKILGTYNSSVTFGQSRLLIVWQRIIMPNGTSIQLDNMQGVDLTGQAGFVGNVDNHFMQLMEGVVLSSGLGAATAVVTNNTSTAQGTGGTNSNLTPGQAAGQGAGQAMINAGSQYTSKVLNMAPTITIPIGYTFDIMVDADMILKPYGS